MKRILIKEISKYYGKEVNISGFVHNVRNLKKTQFIILRDRTGFLQVFCEKNENNITMNRLIESINRESVISVKGVVSKSEYVKLNNVELILSDISIDSNAPSELPIDELSPQNLLLDWRFLDLRQPKNLLIFEIQTSIEHAMREYWIKNDYIEIHSPKLMGSASETGAELFELPYFNSKAYLAQSPQFYKQMAMAAGFDKVFEIGPVFRANSSHTKRHDTEFTSVDVEVSWIESHEDIMKIEEEWLLHIFKSIKSKHEERIWELYKKKIEIPKLPFPRLTLKEVRDILYSLGHKIEHKADLDPEGERLISDYIKNETNHDFLFITEYPIDVRAFYHMRFENKPDITKSFDLIYRGVEVTTGAQREHRPDILIKQAKEKGYDLNLLEYYFNFFRYGCPPHGGFGFGLTRLIMMMLGLESVRQATYLYRGPTRLTP